MRSAYAFDGPVTVAALRALAGLPGVTVEAPAQLSQALDWAAQGLDFADALHLASAAGCEAFFTFDRRLIVSTSQLSSVPVQSP